MKKSEILFLYETSYNVPNGDPFTGEQRYDEETKKILVSDVRIKRFIRTYLEDIEGEHIYVSEKTGAGKTDSKGVLTYIAQNEKWNPCQKTDIAEIMKGLIDVRLFGGISTLTNEETKKIKVNKNECTNGHVQFTGPVQFAALNPSLNRVNLKMHQNTCLILHLKEIKRKVLLPQQHWFLILLFKFTDGLIQLLQKAQI